MTFMTLTRAWLAALVAVCLAVVTAFTSAYADNGPASHAELPPGTTAAYVLFDRASGSVTTQLNQTKQFRSASLVKLLIALDYLSTQGSLDTVPDADLAALQSMLRSSDDVAARNFWQGAGRTQVIDRMVAKLELKHTAPPADPDFWGYTAISASDVVKIYRYLLSDDQQGFGEFILDNLHQSTRCALDGRNQYFGIPAAVPPPFGVKQGWSGFGDTPAGQECSPIESAQLKAASGAEAPSGITTRAAGSNPGPNIDLKSPLLHTSGLVDDDSKILVVLTLYPAQTSWEDAAAQITKLTKSVYRSGAQSSKA